MQVGQIDFDLVGIAARLEIRPLRVPIYQRSYAWKEDEISDFWNDLKSAFTSEQPEYFMGTVVLSKEGVVGRDTIIDGQQRLATTTILLAAIRDEFRTRNDEIRAGIVQSTYLAKSDLASGGQIPQLALNSADDTYFREVVINAIPIANVEMMHASHNLIAYALSTLRARVKEVADAAGIAWPAKLTSWVDFLRERVRVITVEVPNEADAFLIFETLNDRGADLTIADLLKNYLFGRAGGQLDVVRDGWMLALGTLDISAENAVFTTFLRHYWSSRYGAVRERLLYKSIKERVATDIQAVDFISELQKAARHYAAILSSENDFWAQKGATVKDNVDTLNRLELEQNRPLLLAAMQHFSEAELKKLLRAMVSWSVRGLIVGGIGGGTTEKTFCEAAMKIRAGDIQTADQVFDELANIIATDDEFKSMFATARVTRGVLARYYLNALERKAQGTAEPELVPNANEEQVNLEHVLPKNATAAEWSQFSADERKDHVDRIGNLCLLAKGPNGRIGNKSFAIKKPILSASALLLTQAAGANPNWTKGVVTSRQADLAELAVQTWPRKP
jgi:hypothetical protein